MTETTRPEQQQGQAPTIPTQRRAAPQPTAWVGWVYFAGIMMVTIGAIHAVEGLVAIFRSGVYYVPASKLAVNVDYTGWGWFQLIAGLIVAAAGVALFTGAAWARVTAVAVAAISLVVNLAFIAAYPWWAIAAITLDVFVIYAVSVHGAEAKAP